MIPRLTDLRYHGMVQKAASSLRLKTALTYAAFEAPSFIALHSVMQGK